MKPPVTCSLHSLKLNLVFISPFSK